MTRRAFLAIAMVSGLCLALPAFAQMLPDRSQPSITVQDSAKTGERIYVVEPGDTLWSIAEGLYDQPWYWPSLWSYNPQITNPHLIYPGDTLYLSRRSAPGVAQKAIAFAGSRFEPQKVEPMTLNRRVGYISSRDYRESGTIESSREERDMMGTLDEVYARFRMKRCAEQEQKKDQDSYAGPCVRDGDRFTIYRVERPVMHPITGKLVGYKINFLGEGKILGSQKPLTSMLLTRSFSEISRGDLITNLFEPLSMVRAVPNKVELFGVVVDFHHETTAGGQFQYIYIDKGAEDGVERGNRFEVMWRGDGLKGGQVKNLKDFPDEQIGVALVVEAYDRHSLAVLTQSVREIERGMPVVMAKGF